MENFISSDFRLPVPYNGTTQSNFKLNPSINIFDLLSNKLIKDVGVLEPNLFTHNILLKLKDDTISYWIMLVENFNKVTIKYGKIKISQDTFTLQITTSTLAIKPVKSKTKEESLYQYFVTTLNDKFKDGYLLPTDELMNSNLNNNKNQVIVDLRFLQNYVFNNNKSLKPYYDPSSVILLESIKELMINELKDYLPKPMLAHKYKDKIDTFPVYTQYKYNGHRCLAIIENNMCTALLSREGEIIFYPQLTKEIDIFINDMNIKGIFNNELVILDGELYTHGKSLQSITSIVNSKQLIDKQLEYVIYDYATVNEQANLKRLENINSLGMSRNYIVPALNLIKVAPTNIRFNSVLIEQDFRDALDNRYEGLMIREPFKDYEFGERSYSLLKLKEFQDAEFEIIGYNLGQRENPLSDLVFVLKIEDNKTFNAACGGDLIFKQKMLDCFLANRKIDKITYATIKYFDFSDTGVPIHPNFIQIRD